MRTSYEAVVLRYVHDLLTGEFLNVGVVLVCPESGFTGSRTLEPRDLGRIRGAFSDPNVAAISRIGRALAAACGEQEIVFETELRLTPPPRGVLPFVRKVVPEDAANIQVSEVIAGVTSDPEGTIASLFARYVGKVKPRRVARNEAKIWHELEKKLGDARHLITEKIVRVPHLEHKFTRAWKNGAWNAIEPVSLDLLDPNDVRDKALSWVGKLGVLKPWEQETHVTLLLGNPLTEGRGVRAAAIDARELLRAQLPEVEVLEEEDAGKVAERIMRDLAAHRDSSD